jgi:hypothetical protein
MARRAPPRRVGDAEHGQVEQGQELRRVAARLVASMTTTSARLAAR